MLKNGEQQVVTQKNYLSKYIFKIPIEAITKTYQLKNEIQITNKWQSPHILINQINRND